MSVSFVSAEYNPQARLRTISGTTVIPIIPGLNPADTTAVELKNVRGDVTVVIEASDDPVGTSASFVIKGGYGEWPDDATWNWYVDLFSLKLCTVTMPVANTVIVATSPPLVGRNYTMVFNPRIPYAPTIIRSGGAALGLNTLTVSLDKINRGGSAGSNYRVALT